jgi:hypothetical protein
MGFRLIVAHWHDCAFGQRLAGQSPHLARRQGF